MTGMGMVLIIVLAALVVLFFVLMFVISAYNRLSLCSGCAQCF